MKAFAVVPFVILTGLLGLAACTAPAAPNLPNAPTVAVVATQVASIRAGDSTPSATAQAVATQLAPTLQVVLQTVGPIATSVAQSPINITAVNVGADDTTVVVHNSGSSDVSLGGWTLFLGRNIPLSLPPVSVPAGQSITIHMSMGTSTPTDVYLNTASVGGIAITFAPGQRAVLVQPDDQVASVFGTS